LGEVRDRVMTLLSVDYLVANNPVVGLSGEYKDVAKGGIKGFTPPKLSRFVPRRKGRESKCE